MIEGIEEIIEGGRGRELSQGQPSHVSLPHLKGEGETGGMVPVLREDVRIGVGQDAFQRKGVGATQITRIPGVLPCASKTSGDETLDLTVFRAELLKAEGFVRAMGHNREPNGETLDRPDFFQGDLHGWNSSGLSVAYGQELPTEMLAPAKSAVASEVSESRPSEDEPFWWSRALWLQDGSVRRWVDPETGIRFYPIEAPRGMEHRGSHVCLPGVTSVIGFHQSEDERERLEAWRENEILAGRDPDRSKDRGTTVHAMMEDTVGGRPLRPHTEENYLYYSGMPEMLKGYSGFLWNEKPLRRGWDHVWSAWPGEPNRLARVWSYRWGFAGTPDLIGIYGKRTITLADFKTSDKHYVRRTGNIPLWQRTGWMKFTKTRLQLAAYDIAIVETLKIQPTLYHIIVGLNELDVAQQFFEYGPEIAVERERFKRMTLNFWEQVDFSRLVPADN